MTVVCHLLLKSVLQENLPQSICMQGHAKGMNVFLERPKYPGYEETINGGGTTTIYVALGWPAFDKITGRKD